MPTNPESPQARLKVLTGLKQSLALLPIPKPGTHDDMHYKSIEALIEAHEEIAGLMQERSTIKAQLDDEKARADAAEAQVKTLTAGRVGILEACVRSIMEGCPKMDHLPGCIVAGEYELRAALKLDESQPNNRA